MFIYLNQTITNIKIKKNFIMKFFLCVMQISFKLNVYEHY